VRTRNFWQKALTLALVFSFLPTIASSASKIVPGAKCKVLNQKVSAQNKSYTCIKSGKKLSWVQEVSSPKKMKKVSDSLSFGAPMFYGIRDSQLIRRADSGTYFETNSKEESAFDPIRVKAYKELNKDSRNREHPNVEFVYSISSSFPKFLVEYTKRELDEAASLWDSFIGKKITVNVFLVTEKDREAIKGDSWLQGNLPGIFSRFDSRLERPFISGGGGYWQGRDGWAGNIFLATASYLDPKNVNFEWPAIAKHEFVHVVQDYAFSRDGRMRNSEVEFMAIHLQNFREGSANAISFLTAFRHLGWSHDALDWLVWQRADYTKRWKTVRSLSDVKELIIATDVGTPNEAFEQSYAVGALMYEWVLGTYGLDGYKKIINEFSSASSFSQAVESALGISKETLYDQLAPYVYKNYSRIYSQ
jgi:hypothetical protein